MTRGDGREPPLSELRAVLAERGIRPRKRLGQNFLFDPKLLDFIVGASGVGPEDEVLEVGTGTGVLTRALARRAARVYTVEIDRRLLDLARDLSGGLDNIEYIPGDGLAGKDRLAPALVDLREGRGRSARPLLFVANLPYSAATPLLMALLAGPIPIVRMVVMVQREVAERMVASPGRRSFGALSVCAQAQARLKLLRRVPPEVFWPRPRVGSVIVELIPLRPRGGPDPVALRQTAMAVFGQRRKRLIHSLVGHLGSLGPGEERLRLILRDLGVSSEVRGESLSVVQIVDLARRLGDLGLWGVSP
ncbi:MAG: ribosomal RNA small subunit methyltransferase A [Planctomycetes bacterium]|nr:ribosomal RNA small subunit methyltransferase A [Planctomycetota bacterium]